MLNVGGFKTFKLVHDVLRFVLLKYSRINVNKIIFKGVY